MRNPAGCRRQHLPTMKSASSILVRPANSDLTKSFGVSPDFVGEQMQDIRTPAIKNGDASGVSAHSSFYIDDINILRISLHLELSGNWGNYPSVVTYGWLRRAEEAPRLIPLTISTQTEFKKKVYWCRGPFTNYRIFSSRAQLVANGHTQSPARQRSPASNQ